MKLRLFHKIGEGGEDSAKVRKFIVDHSLQEHIEFSNVGFEGARKDLEAATGATATPVLVAGEEIIARADAIIAWLNTNLVR